MTVTKNQMKAILTAAGVAFAPKANAEQLGELCIQTQGTNDMLRDIESGKSIEEAIAAYQTETPAVLEVPVIPPAEGLKIEKDRPMQNGIKRPSAGGRCRAVWDALDAYRAETGELPTSKTVKELAADEGWNPNNASIEFYQWRKFNGIAKA